MNCFVTRATWLGLLLATVGCQCVQPPDAVYSCTLESDCRPGETCDGTHCVPAVPGADGGDAGPAEDGGPSDAGDPDAGEADGGQADGGEGDGGAPDAGGSDAGPTDAGCAAFDWPDDAFQDSNCDGLDGTVDGGLFVDGVVGSDTTGVGSRTAPFLTLKRALEIASAGTVHSIYLRSVSYTEPALVWSVPVSLYGGYSGSPDWVRSNARAIILTGPNGLTADSLPSEVALDSVNVVSGAADGGFGSPSVALRLVNSSLQLRHVSATSGSGANGAPGRPAPVAVNGLMGAPGVSGVVNAFDSTPVPTETMGPCGNGSRGGIGGSVFTAADAGGPANQGGAPGATPSFTCDNVCGCSLDAVVVQDGAGGVDGDAGVSGTNGTGGDGLGRVSTGGLWKPVDGAPGNPAGLGGPGRGGGGGANAVVSLGSAGTVTQGAISGSSGGGGGTPGCPGAPGQGGGSGGASIALLLANSKPYSLVDVTLAPGRGGNGGPASFGSPGGTGGPGGPGGAAPCAACAKTSFLSPTLSPAMPPALLVAGRGGNGGNGGRGGNGGNGGGGGGGPSIGVWCEGSAVSSALFTRGTAPQPGLQGSGSNPGMPGLGSDSHGCPP